ncbi:MAG: carbon-nitrogen hydrolase family protein [Micromonosporaceae bacterium]
MRDRLTVAAVQATPSPGDVVGNAELAARLVVRSAAAGATLAVLPELLLCAYHPPTLYAGTDADIAASGDGRVDDPRLEPLRDAAREHGVATVVGAAVRHPDGRRTCSALVIDGDGEVVVGYDKQNLWGTHEKALFTPGTRGATLDVDGWRLGLGICYDGCFPEHGRAAVDDNVDGYLCPSGFVLGSEHRRDVYYAARALDNTMYVVFANSVGRLDDEYRFNGGAAVYDPQGRPLARAGNDGEAVVAATLDRDELARVRATHTMLADRPSGQGDPRRQLCASGQKTSCADAAGRSSMAPSV